MDPAGPVDDAKNASPTGPWTAHRARRPQAPQALLPCSRFTEKTVTPELLSKWRDEGTQSYFLKWLDRAAEIAPPAVPDRSRCPSPRKHAWDGNPSVPESWEERRWSRRPPRGRRTASPRRTPSPGQHYPGSRGSVNFRACSKRGSVTQGY